MIHDGWLFQNNNNKKQTTKYECVGYIDFLKWTIVANSILCTDKS